jgi:hypothetical protein
MQICKLLGERVYHILDKMFESIRFRSLDSSTVSYSLPINTSQPMESDRVSGAIRIRLGLYHIGGECEHSVMCVASGPLCRSLVR